MDTRNLQDRQADVGMNGVNRAGGVRAKREDASEPGKECEECCDMTHTDTAPPDLSPHWYYAMITVHESEG